MAKIPAIEITITARHLTGSRTERIEEQATRAPNVHRICNEYYSLELRKKPMEPSLYPLFHTAEAMVVRAIEELQKDLDVQTRLRKNRQVRLPYLRFTYRFPDLDSYEDEKY